MKSVLISVAPVSASSTEVDPHRVAEDVIACAKAGAAMVHLHVRDSMGRLTADSTEFRETVRLIQQGCDIAIEASTGGVSQLNIEERCVPLGLPEVDFASLNVGSVNLGQSVYVNSPCDVEYCVERIVKSNKIPDIEVFEIGMIATAQELCRRYNVAQPHLFSIVLGHNGAAPATIEALTALRSFIPREALWGITHYARQDNDIIAAAIGMGASAVRIGFEDSAAIDNGRVAVNNAEIVEHFAGMLRAMGKQPMTPSQLKEVFEG